MKVRFGVGRLLIVVTVMMVLAAGVARAETPLQQMVAEGNASWLVGNWSAMTDDGQEALLSYKWQVGNNMIGISFKMGDYSYQGMIYCPPGQEQVAEIGVDSNGAVVNSQWEPDWEGVVSIRRSLQTDGQKQGMGIVTSKADTNTMKMKVYNLDYGMFSGDPWATLEFKRQARADKEAGA